jgi:hypothetical protein
MASGGAKIKGTVYGNRLPRGMELTKKVRIHRFR